MSPDCVIKQIFVHSINIYWESPLCQTVCLTRGYREDEDKYINKKTWSPPAKRSQAGRLRALPSNARVDVFSCAFRARTEVRPTYTVGQNSRSRSLPGVSEGRGHPLAAWAPCVAYSSCPLPFSQFTDTLMLISVTPPKRLHSVSVCHAQVTLPVTILCLTTSSRPCSIPTLNVLPRPKSLVSFSPLICIPAMAFITSQLLKK